MELDVSEFVNNYDMYDFSHSMAEGGPTAGEDTWREACNCPVKLVSLENEQEVADYIREFGAWDDAEISDMCADGTLNALLLQFIAGDHRELEAGGDVCNLYQSGDKWFFYVGH